MAQVSRQAAPPALTPCRVFCTRPHPRILHILPAWGWEWGKEGEVAMGPLDWIVRDRAG